MISTLGLALLRPYQREAYRVRVRQGGWIPRPKDAPEAHAPGVDPDRVLIFGNGLAVGWGVRTHGLALTGQLARALATRTGRGSDVDALAAPDLTIATAAHDLHEFDLADFDAVVVVVGASDAFRLLPVAQWTAHLKELLRALQEALPETAPVVILGIPPISTVPFFHVKPGAVPDQWAERLNTATEDLCRGRGRFHFVPAPCLPEQPEEDADEERYRAPEVFQAVAGEIAQHLAPLVDIESLAEPGSRARRGSLRHRNGTLGRRSPLFPPTDSRTTSPNAPAAPYLSDARDERFDRIVGMAQKVFGTAGAAFTIVDDSHHWHKAAVGVIDEQHPIDVSFCAATLADSRAFVVTDAWSTDRGLARGANRFYAGYPVEGVEGTRIGTICVFDPEPREPSVVELSFLRELAFELKQEVAAATIGAWPAGSGFEGSGPRRSPERSGRLATRGRSETPGSGNSPTGEGRQSVSA